MKLACVIHRFGPDIVGGSEGHCRAMAEQLAVRHDVTVLTTCAKDHVTWRNEYPAGESRLGALRVQRFPIRRRRSLHRFSEISEIVFSPGASPLELEEWFRENGPDAPTLIDFLAAHGGDYDWILFWSFRYYPTFAGLPLVADRAVLVPTAEDDPAVRLKTLGRFFTLPAALLFLTPEEEALVSSRSRAPLPPSCIVGSGLDPFGGSSDVSLESLGIAAPFLLYLGRVDPNKGCEILLRHFAAWSARTARPVPLVMAGPENMSVPEHPLIRRLGYVGDAAREALLSSATVLVVPSPFESLSMALLEGWNHGVPAVVNGRCRVLKGQALRADGALYYRTFAEFAHCLDRLIQHPDDARQLGGQGHAYVDREYRWPRVVERLEGFLASIERRPLGG